MSSCMSVPYFHSPYNGSANEIASIRFHLRLLIAPEASLRKSLSLNQLAEIFVARGIQGDKRYSYFTLSFSLVVTSK